MYVLALLHNAVANICIDIQEAFIRWRIIRRCLVADLRRKAQAANVPFLFRKNEGVVKRAKCIVQKENGVWIK